MNRVFSRIPRLKTHQLGCAYNVVDQQMLTTGRCLSSDCRRSILNWSSLPLVKSSACLSPIRKKIVFTDSIARICKLGSLI